MRRRLRPLLWRLRWMVAAGCVGLAAWIAIGELRPPPPATTTAVVAADDLDAGTVLSTEHLRTVEITDPPSGLTTIGGAVGTTLTIAVPAGLPLVESMLLGPGLADSAPPGWVVAPVSLADPMLAQLLRVGDRVDLYLSAADTGGRLTDAELIADGVLVLARPSTETAGDSWLGTPPTSQDAVVVVAVAPDDAAAVTGASGFGPFRAVLTAGAP